MKSSTAVAVYGAIFLTLVGMLLTLLFMEHFLAAGALGVGTLLGFASGLISGDAQNTDGHANPPGTQSERDY